MYVPGIAITTVSAAIGTRPRLQLLAVLHVPPATFVHVFAKMLAEMLKAELVAPVSPGALAPSVYPAPGLLRLRSPKVATPATAGTARVPDSVEPPGLLAIANVTVPVKPSATFPSASRAVTTTAGAIGCPVSAPAGCTVNVNCVAGASVMLNAALVAPVSPDDEATSVYPTAALFTPRFANVATPATAFTVVVPASVALPGLLPNASVTAPVNPVAVFPSASRAVTTTGGAIAAFCTMFVGAPVNTSRVAAEAFAANV